MLCHIPCHARYCCRGMRTRLELVLEPVEFGPLCEVFPRIGRSSTTAQTKLSGQGGGANLGQPLGPSCVRHFMRAPAPRIPIALTALALLSIPTRSGAVTGTLDGSYGGPLAIQSSQSNVGGANEAFSQMNQAFGSQLVAAYGTISGGALHLFFTGNLTFWWQLEGNITHWQPL